MVLEAMGQLFPQDVKRGRGGGDGGFMVMEGAYDGSTWWDRDLGKQFQGAVQPSFKVGMSSFLESQQTVGEIIVTGGCREVVAQVVM